MASARHLANYHRLLRAQIPNMSSPASESETPEPKLSRDGRLSEKLSSQAQAIAYLARNLQIEASSMSTSQSLSGKLSQPIVFNNQSVKPRKGTNHQIDPDNPIPSIEFDGYDDEQPKRITIKLTVRRQRKSRKPAKKERPERYRAVGGVSGKLVFKRI
ncbi:hypothetical protein BDZ45DRAFT_737105 [Acephala macrosclerotiorum]|nr:hypothetical protein BDZ45DRAFT_737105 [Acephala macrosclerotiorum]